MRARTEVRDHGLDALRGLAIVAMVASHAAREVLETPHPFALRLFGSLAAPLFITLAGMMTAQTSSRKNYGLGYYFHRGFTILLLAAAVDVMLWQMYPFLGCDVLYLIGAAIPLTAGFCRLPWRWQVGTMAAVVLLPSVLRPIVGYSDEVFAVALADSPWRIVASLPRVVEQWLLTGWFPLLPWLGFSFLGVWVFRWQQAGVSCSGLRYAGAALLAFGLSVGGLFPATSIERAGYTELFYPASLAYLLNASGAVLLLFSMAGWSWLKGNQPFVQLGRCPLLMYLVHLAILHWGVQPLFGEVNLSLFLLIYTALLLIMIGMAGAVQISKQGTTRQLPLMLRLLLGS